MLTGVFEYAVDLWEVGTIERMSGHFVRLLESVVGDAGVRVSRLGMLGEGERRLLLEGGVVGWRREGGVGGGDVRGAGGDVSLGRWRWSLRGRVVGYGELNGRVNRLAHYLVGLGVGPEVLVGMCVERSVEMVVGLLGVLKAGGAYVPLDPTYPRERLGYMLEDAGVSVVLTQRRLSGVLGEFGGRRVWLDEVGEEIESHSDANPQPSASPDNLAYVIYTSGSTGKPKGVAMPHRALV